MNSELWEISGRPKLLKLTLIISEWIYLQFFNKNQSKDSSNDTKHLVRTGKRRKSK